MWVLFGCDVRSLSVLFCLCVCWRARGVARHMSGRGRAVEAMEMPMVALFASALLLFCAVWLGTRRGHLGRHSAAVRAEWRGNEALSRTPEACRNARPE